MNNEKVKTMTQSEFADEIENRMKTQTTKSSFMQVSAALVIINERLNELAEAVNKANCR